MKKQPLMTHLNRMWLWTYAMLSTGMDSILLFLNLRKLQNIMERLAPVPQCTHQVCVRTESRGNKRATPNSPQLAHQKNMKAKHLKRGQTIIPKIQIYHQKHSNIFAANTKLSASTLTGYAFEICISRYR